VLLEQEFDGCQWLAGAGQPEGTVTVNFRRRSPGRAVASESADKSRRGLGAEAAADSYLETSAGER
jgi:hypothetical protein